MIVRHVETVDRRARDRDADRVAVDVARQGYDAAFNVYELERETLAFCLQGVLNRNNFRGFIDTVNENVLLVFPDDEKATIFVTNLNLYKEQKYFQLSPVDCGPTPTQPPVPEILAELEVPVTTTQAPPITIQTTVG